MHLRLAEARNHLNSFELCVCVRFITILFCCFFLSSRSKVMPNGGEKPIDYGSDGSSGSGEETESSSKEEILEEPMPEPHKPKTPPTPPNEVESSSDSSDKRRRDKREPFRPRGRSPARPQPPLHVDGVRPQPPLHVDGVRHQPPLLGEVHSPGPRTRRPPRAKAVTKRREGRGVGEV